MAKNSMMTIMTFQKTLPKLEEERVMHTTVQMRREQNPSGRVTQYKARPVVFQIENLPIEAEFRSFASVFYLYKLTLLSKKHT